MNKFVISDYDIEKIKKGTITSLDPLRFDVFPAKNKRKYILASFLVHYFEPDYMYSESEVNDILIHVYDDFATVRRFMIDYGFLKRSLDCKTYWLNVKLDAFQRFK